MMTLWDCYIGKLSTANGAVLLRFTTQKPYNYCMFTAQKPPESLQFAFILCIYCMFAGVLCRYTIHTTCMFTFSVQPEIHLLMYSIWAHGFVLWSVFFLLVKKAKSDSQRVSFHHPVMFSSVTSDLGNKTCVLTGEKTIHHAVLWSTQGQGLLAVSFLLNWFVKWQHVTNIKVTFYL